MYISKYFIWKKKKINTRLKYYFYITTYLFNKIKLQLEVTYLVTFGFPPVFVVRCVHARPAYTTQHRPFLLFLCVAISFFSLPYISGKYIVNFFFFFFNYLRRLYIRILKVEIFIQFFLISCLWSTKNSICSWINSSFLVKFCLMHLFY